MITGGPGQVTVLGLTIATVVLHDADVALPVARFGALAWLITTGACSRADRSRGQPRV
jgi:hypothetical protein